MDTKMRPFGGHFETHFKAIRNLGSLGPPWLHLGPPWLDFWVILESFWGIFFVILDAVLPKKCFLSRLSWVLKWLISVLEYMVFRDVFFGHMILENTLCNIIRWNTVLILQHALGIQWSDYNITLRILPAGIKHTTGIIENLLCFWNVRGILAAKTEETFPGIILGTLRGVFDNNN